MNFTQPLPNPPQTEEKEMKTGTDLIYFKYDFGYEFGILNPGRDYKLNGKCNESTSSASKYGSHTTTGTRPVLNERKSTFSSSNDIKYERNNSTQRIGYTGSIERGDCSPDVGCRESCARFEMLCRIKKHLIGLILFLCVK